jgi:hypothetical protein
VEIGRKDHNCFAPEESEAIIKIFGSCGGNFWCGRTEEAAMILGLTEKKPICSACGCTFSTEEEAQTCSMSH